MMGELYCDGDFNRKGMTDLKKMILIGGGGSAVM